MASAGGKNKVKFYRLKLITRPIKSWPQLCFPSPFGLVLDQIAFRATSVGQLLHFKGS